MILTCPQCAARYQADEAKFPPTGRTVRCAKCLYTWHHIRPTGESRPLEASSPALESKPEFTQSPNRIPPELSRTVWATPPAQPYIPPSDADKSSSRRTNYLVAIASGGWLVAAVLFVALLVTHDRVDNAVIWPHLASHQSSAQAKVNMQGVDLRNVGYRRETDDGEIMIVLTGTLSNSTDRALPVPKTIRVTLSDEKNQQLFHAAIPAKVAMLGPGESVVFRARIRDLPSAKPKLHMALED